MQSMANQINDPDHWQDAQDRVLLYLKKLGIPAIRSLEIADNALKHAMADQQAVSPEPPVRLVMCALHKMIHSDPSILSCSVYKDYPVVFSRRHQESFATPLTIGKESGINLDFSASPPINRGHMVIRKL